jgi:hypothetical protein
MQAGLDRAVWLSGHIRNYRTAKQKEFQTLIDLCLHFASVILLSELNSVSERHSCSPSYNYIKSLRQKATNGGRRTYGEVVPEVNSRRNRVSLSPPLPSAAAAARATLAPRGRTSLLFAMCISFGSISGGCFCKISHSGRSVISLTPSSTLRRLPPLFSATPSPLPYIYLYTPLLFPTGPRPPPLAAAPSAVSRPSAGRTFPSRTRRRCSRRAGSSRS